MVRSFHSFEADADPLELLKPENHVSTPWGDADKGPCDKCRGRGTTGYRCRSCQSDGRQPDCPACEGCVEFEDVCPACEGDGEITRVQRRGISSFPRLAGLRSYMEAREVDLDGYVAVELEAELSGDRDLDADEGAILVIPGQILGRHPLG